MQQFTVNQPTELAVVAEAVLGLAIATEQPPVVALNGDLGAGKTSFVQVLAKLIKTDQVPNSPTFVVLKSYPANHPQWKKLVHMDAYRLETIDELRPLKFDELLRQKDSIICIEWAKRIAPKLPPQTIRLDFSIADSSRLITINYDQTENQSSD